MLRICAYSAGFGVALASFSGSMAVLAAWRPGCGPGSYAGNTTRVHCVLLIVHVRNVLTTQGSHRFSHTVALFTLWPDRLSCSNTAIFTRSTYVRLLHSFVGLHCKLQALVQNKVCVNG